MCLSPVDAKACLKERDVFRHLGCTKDSWGQLLKYQPGFEDNMFRGQTNVSTNTIFGRFTHIRTCLNVVCLTK